MRVCVRVCVCVKDDVWLEEYSRGSCNEIYVCSLQPGFIGWKVTDVAMRLFDKFNATLVALESASGELLFCPLPKEASIDESHANAHVITRSAFVATEIDEYSKTGAQQELQMREVASMWQSASEDAEDPHKHIWLRKLGGGRMRKLSASLAKGVAMGETHQTVSITSASPGPLSASPPLAAQEVATAALVSADETGGSTRAAGSSPNGVVTPGGVNLTISSPAASTSKSSELELIHATPSPSDPPALSANASFDVATRARIAKEMHSLAVDLVLNANLGPAQLLQRLHESIDEAVTDTGGAFTGAATSTAAAPSARAPTRLGEIESRASFGSLKTLAPRTLSKLRASGSLENVLWDRLIDPTITPEWQPSSSGHILLCGGPVPMGQCARCLVNHWPHMQIIALCNVPIRGAASFPDWLERASVLLTCPVDRLTMVRGSDLQDEDLLFAGAASASSVLVFSPAVAENERQTADVATVLTAMRVQRIAPGTFNCADLHEASNARFFRLALPQLQHQTNSPGPASASPRGRRVKSKAISATVAALAPSSALPTLRERQRSWHSDQGKMEFIGVGAHSQSARATTDPAMNRTFAGGHAFSTVMLDRLLCRGYFNNQVIRIIEMIAAPSVDGANADGGGPNRLQLRRVPKALAGSTYSVLFDALVNEQQLLPLGLFRVRTDKFDKAIEYVMTNPPKETKISSKDRVYVIGKMDA